MEQNSISHKKGKWWRRLLLVIAVGPGAVGLLYIVVDNYPHIDESVVFSVSLALWGLTGGILQRSLYRSLLGLNLGAALGYTLNLATRGIFEPGWPYAFIIDLIVTGMFLGAILHSRRVGVLNSIVGGAVAGVAGFGFMGGMFLVPIWIRIDTDLLNIVFYNSVLICGLGIFYWLLIDYFPRRRSLMPRAPKVSLAAIVLAALIFALHWRISLEQLGWPRELLANAIVVALATIAFVTLVSERKPDPNL